MSLRIQIVQSRGVVPRVIRWRTDSWANHIEMIDTERRVTIGARPRGGIRERDSSLDDYIYVEQFVLNTIRSPEYLAKMWAWLLAHQGTPYGYRSVLGVAFDLKVTNQRSMDCSEAIYLAAWYGAGFPLLSTRPSAVPALITPRDHLLSRALVFVEGNHDGPSEPSSLGSYSGVSAFA